ncbi:MAG: hypothetical protein ACI8XB_002237, partial [Patiriisocius sp.]
LQQFVGYRHLSNNKRINFTVGFEVIEGFTQSRRDFNFDLGKKDDQKRVDLLIGLKASWSILIFKPAPNAIYYN